MRVSAMTDTVLIIDIEELGRIERFEATLDGRVLCRSRQPLLAAARVLLAEGAATETVIGMRRLGCTPIDMTGVLGDCARLTVEDPDRNPLRFRPWKAREIWAGAAPAASDDREAAE